MKMQLRLLLIMPAILLLAITSCQKIISINTNNAAPQLVIEGNLTDIYGDQMVHISKTVPFNATNNYPPVSGATVIVTDSAGDIIPFTEESPGYYYNHIFAGNYKETYTLTVTTGGKVYKASSTMPAPVELDSVSTTSDQFDKNNPFTIVVNYQDPPGVPNQYKFDLYINSVPVQTIFTNNDEFTDGRYVHEQLFQQGTNIVAGDTAKVDMECIDENIYQYWFSLSQLQINGPGGGITPSNPPSNFNNGALGYFSAHTSSIKIGVVP